MWQQELRISNGDVVPDDGEVRRRLSEEAVNLCTKNESLKIYLTWHNYAENMIRERSLARMMIM